MKQTEILNKLKSAFPNINYKDDYRLKSIEANLFFPSYEGIDERANSIRSSAAMIYNTIGPDSITLDNIKYTKIEYERKFPVLKNRPAAQLDVSMLNENKTELVLVEAKCLEWMDKPKPLKDAYLVTENYLLKNSEVVIFFKETFKRLLSFPEKRAADDNTKILPFYQKYDAIQMNIHILGIYNFCARKEENIPKRIRLLNIVWDYDEAEEYQIEEREGKEYVAYANVTFRNLFKHLGVDFSVEYVRYSDFLNRVDWTNDVEHRNYLKRYEV